MPEELKQDAQPQTGEADVEVQAEATPATEEKPVEQEKSFAEQKQDEAETAVKDAETAHWSAQLPEEAQEKLKDFESIEDALEAIEKGKEFVGPKSVDDVELSLPEGVEGAEDHLSAFKQFCVDEGLPTSKAQKLLEWQSGFLAEANKAYMEQGEKTLREKWPGEKFDRNREQALVALAAIDRRMEGQLGEHLKASGYANDPYMIEALHVISTLISEDSLGGASPGAESKPLSREDAYKKGFGQK